MVKDLNPINIVVEFHALQRNAEAVSPKGNGGYVCDEG
jgi:hypothetical protein